VARALHRAASMVDTALTSSTVESDASHQPRSGEEALHGEPPPARDLGGWAPPADPTGALDDPRAACFEHYADAGPGDEFPFPAEIEAGFGRPIRARAQLDRSAADACDQLGAEAFTIGDRVSFRGPPDLHTAAHEAAHVLQQREGVQLDGDVGRDGDE